MKKIMKNIKPREKRKNRIKLMIGKKGDRMRLSVFRSNRYIYCQLIDDIKKKTIISLSDKELDLKKEKKMTKFEKAKMVGSMLALKAKKAKIEKILFDRNGYRYHGRIKALAEGAREGGLIF